MTNSKHSSIPARKISHSISKRKSRHWSGRIQSPEFARSLITVTITSTAPLVIGYPAAFNEFSTDQLATSIANFLHREIFSFPEIKEKNIPSRRDLKSAFFSSDIPMIGLRDYVHRFAVHCKCSNVHFLMALKYLERIGEKHIELKISSRNVHRLMTSAIGVAIQQHRTLDEENIQKVGGIPTIGELRKIINAFQVFIDQNTSLSQSDMSRLFDTIDSMKRIDSIPREDTLSDITVSALEKESDWF